MCMAQRMNEQTNSKKENKKREAETLNKFHTQRSSV